MGTHFFLTYRGIMKYSVGLDAEYDFKLEDVKLLARYHRSLFKMLEYAYYNLKGYNTCPSIVDLITRFEESYMPTLSNLEFIESTNIKDMVKYVINHENTPY